jgi:hypothetical protein
MKWINCFPSPLHNHFRIAGEISQYGICLKMGRDFPKSLPAYYFTRAFDIRSLNQGNDSDTPTFRVSGYGMAKPGLLIGILSVG